MKTGIYAIYDNKAQDILSNFLQVQKHEAVAVRTFTDIALVANSQIPQHPEDYDLVRLGWIHGDNKTLEPDYGLILSGTSLMAALQPQNKKEC